MTAEQSVLDISTPHGFVRELMPSWLSCLCVVEGQRPLATRRGLRVVDLQCGRGIHAAVIAACHPKSEVWAYEADPSLAETAQWLADAAGLHNLHVLHRDLTDLGYGGIPADLDLVLMNDVLSASPLDVAHRVTDQLRLALRPGGLVVASYRTLSGWSELMPLRRLAQLATSGPPTDETAAATALGWIGKLEASGLGYLAERPYVAAFLRDLSKMDTATATALLLSSHLEPRTFSEVHAAMRRAGCNFLTSARPSAHLGVGTPQSANELVADITDVDLRETYRDLAARPLVRVDVFRKGRAAIQPDGLTGPIGEVRLSALPMNPNASRSLRSLAGRHLPGLEVSRLEASLGASALTVRELVVAAAQTASAMASAMASATLVRVLLASGTAHPVSEDALDPVAAECCAALTAALELEPVPLQGLVVDQTIGSAIPPASLDTQHLGQVR